jgi:TIR domain
MPKTYDVFISYSQRDSTFVRKLASRLARERLTVFFDEASIAIGDSLADSLIRAVENARHMIVVMSPAYFRSDWGRREMDLALEREFDSTEQQRIRVLPLLLEDCEVPPILATKLYADCRTDEAFENSFPKILAAIRSERSLFGFRREKTEKLEVTEYVGQVSVAASESNSLRLMIEELKAKVDAFTAQTPVPSNNASSVHVAIDPKLCFVVMPFGSAELNDVYDFFVKPSLEAHCLLVCERGDDVFGSNVVMEDIRRSLERARVVVADLTGRNPNVFYEVGIAHTLNKDVLLLSQSMADVPFDLRHRRVLVYEYSPKGCKILEKRIVENVGAMLAGGA